MKILQINVVCGIRSTGRIVTDIHNLLISENHESNVAYGRSKATNCDTSIAISNTFDNFIHFLISRLFDKHGFGSRLATIKLINTIKSLKPDIIHLHNIHGYYLNIQLLFEYLKESNTPIFWTLHDCWAFTGHCAYFDYSNCNKWKTGCYSCPSVNDYPISFIDNSKWNYETKKKIFTGVNKLTLITPSAWLSNLVKQSFLKEYTIKTINNGIDLKEFKPLHNNYRNKNNLDNKFLILGVAADFNDRKGYGYFLEIAKLLKTDETIILVGLTKKQIKQLPDNIIGLEKTNNTTELAEIYSSSDVFINPTLEDNFPTTNLEALACGTPVITFKSGGSPECLDSNCGIIVERGDLQGLLTAIETVKINGKGTYTINCQKRAHDLYDKNHRFNDYIELYKFVLEEKNT